MSSKKNVINNVKSTGNWFVRGCCYKKNLNFHTLTALVSVYLNNFKKNYQSEFDCTLKYPKKINIIITQ